MCLDIPPALRGSDRNLGSFRLAAAPTSGSSITQSVSPCSLFYCPHKHHGWSKRTTGTPFGVRAAIETAWRTA